jgi:hypothetical protein
MDQQQVYQLSVSLQHMNSIQIKPRQSKPYLQLYVFLCLFTSSQILDFCNLGKLYNVKRIDFKLSEF